jgi:hypothetical protein
MDLSDHSSFTFMNPMFPAELSTVSNDLAAPFPYVARYVIKAVAVRFKSVDRCCAEVAVGLSIVHRKLTLPDVAYMPPQFKFISPGRPLLLQPAPCSIFPLRLYRQTFPGFEALHAKGHYPNHIFKGAKGDIWEGGHREPTIISYPPAIEAGGVSNHLISLSDLYRTIADFVEDMVASLAEYIRLGRSTPLEPQENEDGNDWPQFGWIEEYRQYVDHFQYD